ncbi:hypothetical protein, partial [uncultured Bilophila sp.]|uniref:hypothetical protein n=1 Tax=uncultured Bilophila sp. TaxID=529385 RepID=UPI002602603D
PAPGSRGSTLYYSLSLHPRRDEGEKEEEEGEEGDRFFLFFLLWALSQEMIDIFLAHWNFKSFQHG